MSGPDKKWARGVTAQTPVEEMARAVLRGRLRDVAKLLGRAAESKPGTPEAVKDVHALRVATRRAHAALGVFRGSVKGKDLARARARLRAIRKAAGEARDMDVQVEILANAARGERDAGARRVLRELAARTRARRREAHKPVEDAAGRWPAKELRGAWDRVADRAGEAGRNGASLLETARAAAQRRITKVRRAATADLRVVENVHALRLKLKQLRYAMEIVGPCFAPVWPGELEPRLVEVQRGMGEITDAWVLLERLREERAAARRAGRAVRGGAALTRLIAHRRKVLNGLHRKFLEQWNGLESGGFFERMRGELCAESGPGASAEAPPAGVGAVGARASLPSRVLRPVGFIESKPERLNGTLGEKHGERAAGAKASASPALKRRGNRRIAAIDAGTNSIRLVVAEAQPDGSYRILDDEKEITRLGKGLTESGKLARGAVEHSVETIARMKSIAQGYGVEQLQLVGTAATREAENIGEFRRLIGERTGLELRVISGQEEALLAYRSAASAFDLVSVPAAVVDIGGGSTEIVLSAPAGRGEGGGRERSAGGDAGRVGVPGGGVIERVYTMPLGAVRLTDRFGGPAACAGERYEEMREFIKETLSKEIGRAPLIPQLVIGTGGTLTTVAAMAQQRELGASNDGLFSGNVQGMEVSRAELKHLLEFLRKTPVKERTKVPGLPADRADIIVAGLAIVDGVLKRLGANRIRAHEGGIRDGILLGMVGGPTDGDLKRDPMKAVRRFAKSCGYEAAHVRHVTGLALQIFDQLAAEAKAGRVRPEEGMSFSGEARLLLEAAALLHDIGYLINYAQHHKHSYHLIVHAELPGLTSRQVQVVANVARYHRAAEPKGRHRAFASLPPEDRGLVRGLSAVLRVADGLDRTHMQSVRSVRVRAERGAAFFTVESENEPGVDMWGAVRKSGLFKKSLGLLPHFEWAPTGAIAPGSVHMSAAVG